MITLTRRLSVTVAVLTLAAAGAGCGRGGGGGDDDVASIDNASATTETTEDGGGGANRPDSQEFQDAALAYAQCMRDHGIDVPDPTFTDDGGGMTQRIPEGEDPESDEFQAAEEECRSAMEDALPEPEQLSPQEQAERQDQLLEMAQCMRDKGYDMPDPEVDSSGRVRIGRNAGPNEAGPSTGPPADEEQFQQDMEACQEAAGMEGLGGGPRTGGPSA
jgi:hypothetical protein